MALDNSLLNKITNNDISITELDFSNAPLTEPELSSLAAALKNNRHIKSIDLSNNKLSTPGGIKLLKALNNNTSLIRLSFRNCSIAENADVYSEVGSVISSCANLESVDIQRNGINNIGHTVHPAAVCMVNALQSNTYIIRFDCSDSNSSFHLTEGQLPTLKALTYSHGERAAAGMYSGNQSLLVESKKLQNSVSAILARNIAAKERRQLTPSSSSNEQAAIIKAQGDLLNKQSDVIANLQTQMQQMMQTQQLILQAIQLNTGNNNDPGQASTSARLFKG